jgi:hypothetical protein
LAVEGEAAGEPNQPELFFCMLPTHGSHAADALLRTAPRKARLQPKDLGDEIAFESGTGGGCCGG